MNSTETIRAYMAEIGRRGGNASAQKMKLAGVPAEHFRAMARKRWDRVRVANPGNGPAPEPASGN